MAAARNKRAQEFIDRWQFWSRNLADAPAGTAEELAAMEGQTAEPIDAAEMAAMDLQTYARSRDRLRVKDASDIHGVAPWKRDH